MKDRQHSIFREEAIRRYAESKEKAVLPRLVSPQTFAYLWFLLGLLSASGLVAWFTRVPLYASGSAVVVCLNDELNDKTHRCDGEIVVAAFFPPQHLSRLQTAQKLFLSFDDDTGIGGGSRNENRLGRPIIAVEPKIMSPDAIHKQFALNAQTVMITQPAAVAIAPLEPLPTILPASAYLGSVGRVKTEVGSRRIATLLPLIGHFFEQ